MEKEHKKPWTKPQLIVLVRGKPEESVLLACKSSNQSGGPFTTCLPTQCSAVAAS